MINKSQGIGLRSEHQSILADKKIKDIDFLELSPENWMSLGGFKKNHLDKIATNYPLVAHGLNLSIGGFAPLNIDFVKQVKAFLDEYDIKIYSDHLCFTDDEKGYLYDLLPVPRQSENIDYIVSRIQQVQDIIQRPLVLENISYYHQYENDIPESYFINSILQKSGAKLLLDINNVYVNALNHKYDPYTFIDEINKNIISYYHIAGHLQTDDVVLDTHGKDVNLEVKNLAKYTFKKHGWFPLLLERDNRVPSILELVCELNGITKYIDQE
jgi:uncharacterized protein (UPF0276 family)